MSLELFAACLPGLEPFCADELRALGASPEPMAGGVAFRGDLDLLFAAHLHLGTCSHVLLRCGQFRCLHLAQLATRAAQLPWRQWLRNDVPFAVTATAKRSKLYHTGAIAERVERGIAQALGLPAPLPVPAGGAPVTIAVRFVGDIATLSLDTSPEPLHRRGYRKETGKAPLREDLAFALLRAARVDAATAVLDPFCGAGTIAIEAAAMMLGLPPGRLRPPPLPGTALQDDARWQRLLAALPPRPLSATVRVAASDRDAGAVAAARANAERAGTAAAIAFTCCAVTAAPWFEDPATAPRPLVVATNPPFGHRIGSGQDLAPLYQTLGHRVQSLGDSARLALVAHDPRLARRTGVRLQQVFATQHGGLPVQAFVGAGAN